VTTALVATIAQHQVSNYQQLIIFYFLEMFSLPETVLMLVQCFSVICKNHSENK